MNRYTNQSEATRELSPRLRHGYMRPGSGVITMPTHDDIAKRAYEIYLKNDCQQGQCKMNWQQAERDLRADDCGPF